MQFIILLAALFLPFFAAHGETKSPPNLEHYLYPNRAISFHYFEPGLASLNLEYWGSLPEGLPRDQFWKTTRKTIEGGTVDAYIFSYPSYWECDSCAVWPIAFDTQTQTYNYVFPGTGQPQSTPTSGSPSQISVEELASLLKEKNILIICGPGFAVHAGVLTRQGFIDAVVNEGMLALIKDPIRVLDSFVERSEAGIYNAPTFIHDAIAALAKSKGCMVLTSNFDLLLQKTGIPVEVIYSTSYDPSVLDNALKHTDLVLTIGMGTDIFGILTRYKQLSPQGLIASVNLEQPDYLRDEDYLLQGDLVSIIPELKEAYFNK